jgi:tRNA G18 (ribose-2'-O)-methylase SpoU
MDSELWAVNPHSKGSPLKYNVHNVFQDMPNEKAQMIAKTLHIPFAILLFNLDGNMNIGMTVRTAVVMGCSDVYIIGKKKYDPRGAVGAKNYIHIHRFAEINPSTFFQENNLIPILIEQGGIPLEDFNFKPYIQQSELGFKPIIVMGSEGTGIPSEWLELNLGPRITISQMGILRSLNVSIASSIVVYEYTKQWRKYVADKLCI